MHTLETIAGRIMSRVTLNPETGCWVCSYSKRSGGFPGVTIKLGKNKAKDLKCAEVIFEFNGGKIPEGMTLHPLCGINACVNPKHMRTTEKPTAGGPPATFTADQVRAKIKAIEEQYQAARSRA